MNWRKLLEKKPKYTCPVCGFDELRSNPYKNMPPISPEIYKLQPPYQDHWGFPSYEVCPCCGMEFGNDDDCGYPHLNSTFSAYLAEWLDDLKGEWLCPEEKPPQWDLLTQMQKAGIPIPSFLLKR